MRKLDRERLKLGVLFGIIFLLLFSWKVGTAITTIYFEEGILANIGKAGEIMSATFSTEQWFSFSTEALRYSFFSLLFFLAVLLAFGMFRMNKKYTADAKKPGGVQKVKADKGAAVNIDEMIGLRNIKGELNKILGFYKMQYERKKKGMAYTDLNLNLVFYGNPGTGKTVVARYISQELFKAGITKENKLIECDRTSFVSDYMGQTASKTRNLLENALGGVLFIDEAYTLTINKDTYGQEAVDTLLKFMEDHKEELIVIVAGYEAQMKQFIDSNPGLQSRFTKHIDFDDYSPEELTQILLLNARKRDYALTEAAQADVLAIFTYLFNNKDVNFANGRLARNIFEELIQFQAARLGQQGRATKQDMMTIDAADTREFAVQYGIEME